MSVSPEYRPVINPDKSGKKIGSVFSRRIPRRRFLASSATSIAGLATITIPNCTLSRSEPSGNATSDHQIKPIYANERLLSVESRIIEENQKKGDELNWGPLKEYKEIPFGLYIDKNSVAAGEKFQIFASAKDSASASLEIFRIGHYGGRGARRVFLKEDVKIPNQGWWLPETGLQDSPRAIYDKNTGLLDCNWEPTATVETTENWVSGYYLIRLNDNKGYSSETPLVVRDDQNPGKLVVLFSTITPQAYNNFGGQSLYGYTSFQGKRASKVSFNRPLGKKFALGQEILDDYNPQFVRWIEQKGYDVTYCTDYDLHNRPDLFNKPHGFICVGHSEYWTAQMFDNALAARDSGKHAAFLGANDIYWQIRLESDFRGERDRTIVCYKNQSDPQIGNPRLATVRFVSPEIGRPQSALTGMIYGSELGGELGELSPMNQDWITGKPGSTWILDGTELKPGDRIPSLVGREYDTLDQAMFAPENLDIVAASPVRNAHGQKGTAHTTLHKSTFSGSMAFSAGTLRWNRALTDKLPFYDWRVNRITTNFLDKMLT